MNSNRVETILQSNGFTDYKFINPKKDIVLAHWVRFKCMFGCRTYGHSGSCPPAVPSVDECSKMIREYNNAVIIRSNMQWPSKEERYKMVQNLLNIEREIFLAGYYKAFILPHFYCNFCEKCTVKGNRTDCVDKSKSRPTPEAMGIDIFQTARNAGYTIDVIKNKEEFMNRFSFVLID